MNVFFTSDTHYGHANIIKYANRPFADANEMTEAMVTRWNEVVKPGDEVYHLGDFAFTTPEIATQIAQRLVGQKHLVWGNHDKALRRDRRFSSQWNWTRDLTEIKVGDQRIVLCHYAMLVWNQSHRGAWHLFGHSHGTLPTDQSSLRQDVGVDVWDFRPVSYEDIAAVMAKRDYRPIDRHGDQ